MIWFLSLALAEQPKTRPSDAERGEELYRKHCVQCHGVRNAGDGPVAAAMVAPVPDLQGQLEAKEPFITVILFGKGAMPGYEATFHKQDAVRVLKYQASLGPAKSLPPVAGKKVVPKPVEVPKKDDAGEGPEREDEDGPPAGGGE